MIGFKIETMKGLFFDRKKVMDATERAERSRLSRFGAFVRRRAQTSIKPRKKSSQPGTPPSGHDVQWLRKNIFFVFEPSSRSVVIGPTKLNMIGNAPEALEKGGETTVYTGRRRNRKARKITISARPYMGPAFDAELKRMDPLWRNSIR